MTGDAAIEPQRQLRGEIAARLGCGDSLDNVERELIAPSRLSEDQQAALWLYGWSLTQRERRRGAFTGLEPLGPAGRSATASAKRLTRV